MVSTTAGGAAAMLLLGDGRLPAGGYAHSGGLEATVRRAGVTDAASFETFLTGRAQTAGYVAACFAAATCDAARADDRARLQALDEELDARMPSPATRTVSRMLGRALQRALRSIAPSAVLDRINDGAHQPMAYGVGAAALDLRPRDAASVMLHESVAGPAAAALKVLATDPYTVHRVLASLTGLLDTFADRAAGCVDRPAQDLPAHSSPLLDLAAETQQHLEVRLFAS